jgi:hypothetical protein
MVFGLSVPRVLSLGSSLTSLEAVVGRKAGLIESYQDFTEPMYAHKLKAAIKSRRTPVVTWEPFDSDRPTVDRYPLDKIGAGAYDGYLIHAAERAARVGKPFIIRFAHEMNGFWYPWGQPRPLNPQNVVNPANTPTAYRAAYRHVVKVFRAHGATNVAWMWSPNVNDANPGVTLESLYPGNKYVDVIGLSGYLTKTTDTFESRFRQTMTELSGIGGNKPVIIAETGAVVGADRGTRIRDLVDALSAERRVAGFIYFSQPDKTIDYGLEGDPDAEAALAQALAGPRFTESTTSGAAFALTPQITGDSHVGSTLVADLAWRGTPTSTSATWLSCATAQTSVADCTSAGTGNSLTMTADLHDQYVRASLSVASTSSSDEATSAPVGPVLSVPPTATPAGIDLLTGSVRVRLPEAPAMATNWVLSLDGGAREYLPISTTDKWYNGLPSGSVHTLTLAAADGPSAGQPTTVTFAAIGKPSTPTYTVHPGSYTVTFPDPADGQTGWVAVVDGVEQPLPLTTSTVTESGLTAGTHSFGLRAVAGDGRTNPQFVYPTVT